jgi:hypothetical protein
MSFTSRKARPFLIGGMMAFGACIWPTLYSPLGEDTAGNPMRENRITGVEEIKPLGSSEWMDAAKFRELAGLNKDNSLNPVVVQR